MKTIAELLTPVKPWEVLYLVAMYRHFSYGRMQGLKWVDLYTILLLFICASRWVQSDLLIGD